MKPILYDIHPLQPIADESFSDFILLCFFIILSLLIGVFILSRHLSNRKKSSYATPLWKKRLLDLHINDTKKTAYTLTRWGKEGGNKSEALQKLYSDLIPMLEPYKYHPTPPPFDPQTQEMILTFLHEIKNV